MVTEEKPAEDEGEETAPEEEAENEPEPEESPETPPAAPPNFDEMKLVVIMKADNALIGVQSPDCDPVYKTFSGNLSAVLKQIPALVKEAKEKWTVSPKYPKADLPEPEPPPARTTTTTTTRSSRASSQPKEQPSFF